MAEYYDIENEAEFNSTMTTLKEFRVGYIGIDCRHLDHIVVGESNSIPNTKIILNIKPRGLFKRLIDSILDNE